MCHGRGLPSEQKAAQFLNDCIFAPEATPNLFFLQAVAIMQKGLGFPDALAISYVRLSCRNLQGQFDPNLFAAYVTQNPGPLLSRRTKQSQWRKR